LIRYLILRVRSSSSYLFVLHFIDRVAVSGTPSRTPSAAVAAAVRSTSNTRVRPCFALCTFFLNAHRTHHILFTIRSDVSAKRYHCTLSPPTAYRANSPLPTFALRICGRPSCMLSLRPVRIPVRKGPLVRVGPEGEAPKDDRHWPDALPQGGFAALQERVPVSVVSSFLFTALCFLFSLFHAGT
jgi:hypothetical protein